MTNPISHERFETFLAKCTLQRLEALGEEFEHQEAVSNLSYQEHFLYEQLERVLTPEWKPLLVKYSDTLTQLLTLQQDFFYRCGLMDCYAILRKMERGTF